MRARKEDIQGWIGSVVFHALLAVVLLLWHIDLSTSEPEFIEVSWGSISAVPTTAAGRPNEAGTEGKTTVSAIVPKARGMDLPQRTFNTEDEILKVGRGKKLDIDEPSVATRVHVVDVSRGEKDRDIGSGIDQKGKYDTPGVGEVAGTVPDPRAAGTVGKDIGASVSVSMQWNDGGTRRMISGDLPEYPSGANVEAQIKIETIVLPDGSVKSLKPSQKGNTKLEEAAMKSVRLWKFEPLRASTPQQEQACRITFNFHLQ